MKLGVYICSNLLRLLGRGGVCHKTQITHAFKLRALCNDSLPEIHLLKINVTCSFGSVITTQIPDDTLNGTHTIVVHRL